MYVWLRNNLCVVIIHIILEICMCKKQQKSKKQTLTRVLPLTVRCRMYVCIFDFYICMYIDAINDK